MIEDNVLKLPESIVKRIDCAGRMIAPTDSVIAEAVEIDNGSVTQDGVARVFCASLWRKTPVLSRNGKVVRVDWHSLG